MVKKGSIIKIIVALFFLSNCASNKFKFDSGKNDIEGARINAINHFNETYYTPEEYILRRNGKPFDIFWIRIDTSINDKYVFSFSPMNQNYIALRTNDTLGRVPDSYFPNRFKEKENKLFIWKDNTTPLQKDILNVLTKYDVLDSTDIKLDLGILPPDFEDKRMYQLDHNLKSVDYYICRDNMLRYKTKITSVAVGYYRAPKLKCGGS